MTIFRHLVLLFLLSSSISVFAGSYQSQQQKTDTIIIRFEYKQSALFQSFTLETLDSAIDILLKNRQITLSIDGYAHKDEGTDTICYFLSLNRAIFIQTYVLGRGIDSSRITSIKAYGKRHQKFTTKDKNGFYINCRAELRLIYPPPPRQVEFFDRDEDGIADSEDKCPDVFGYKENGGCPDSGAVIIPFAVQESALYSMTYNVLDSVVSVLKEDPSLTVTIGGHAHLAEGALSLCERLASERAEMVKLYLLSRQINPSRIMLVKSYGISRPINPAKTPKDILRNVRAEILIKKQ
ncbi:MAG: OmpA family protein [Ferruginibacter sp.]